MSSQTSAGVIDSVHQTASSSQHWAATDMNAVQSETAEDAASRRTTTPLGSLGPVFQNSAHF